MKKLPTALTSEQLQSLTARHIARYSSMLRAWAKGATAIRPLECGNLLATWKRIAELGGSLDAAQYTSDEITEIQDAWFDEYDSEEKTG